MITAKNPNYTTLLYRSEQSRRDVAQPLAVRLEDYYPVTSYPKAEMLEETAAGTAANFLQLTHSPKWRWQMRRPIEAGDVFTYAPDLYMFIDHTCIHHFADRGLAVFGFPWWPNLAVAQFQRRQQLCKALT